MACCSGSSARSSRAFTSPDSGQRFLARSSTASSRGRCPRFCSTSATDACPTMGQSPDRIFSFEFFPPATPEGVAKLRATREQLARLGPKFFSVTYGAGGSTRDRTLAAVLEIQASGQRAAPACLVHRLDAGERARDPCAPIASMASATSSRCAATFRREPPTSANSATRTSWSSSSAAVIGDWFHIEVAAYPEYHPQAHTPA